MRPLIFGAIALAVGVAAGHALLGCFVAGCSILYSIIKETTP